jgi:uncharacterized protein YdhG (YjbR/CyaY superfamily)
MERAQAVDRYIASQSDDRRVAMETLRDTINAAAPDATETISYGMPALKGKAGKFLLSYDAFKRHYSLFPASDAVIEAGGEELKPYLSGKSTIQFPADEPIPTALITRIVKARVVEEAAEAEQARN